MKFQRRHYQAIAAEMREARRMIDQTHDIGSDTNFWKVQLWEDMVCDLAGMFGRDNPGFQIERWYRATGYQRRPDGAMYA